MATAKKASSKLKLLSSDGERNKRACIQGPPGSGKSTLAATLAAKCPAKLPAAKKTKLTEVVWVPFDTNATVALRDVNLVVDEVPVSDIMYQYDAIGDVMKVITDYIFEAVENGKTLVVLDTLTKLDKMILRWWEENGPTTKSGARDSFAIWRNIIAMHERFHTNMDLLEVDLISLMHSKPRGESDSAQKKARAAQTAGGMADIRFDFMYEDVVNIWRRDNDFILVTECKAVRGGYEYACHTDPYLGFEAKSRYRNSLPSGKHPADLKAIYNTLEKKLK